MEFLQAVKGKIVDQGRPVYLKGVNLGGWLMPEAYFMHAPNRGYRFFKAGFIKELGEREFLRIEQAFRDNFIKEDDLKKIAVMGFDHVRLPFHYGLLSPATVNQSGAVVKSRLSQKAQFDYALNGLRYLARGVAWAKKYGLRVILDMHAVPGAQNTDWHADSDGKVARFWRHRANQEHAIELWKMVAGYFKDEPAVIGYDVLNEAVLDDDALLNRYYRAAIKAIRTEDKKHILFIEGNRWARDIKCLDKFEDDNLVLGMHYYEPMQFVFNLTPDMRYPMKGWDSRVMFRQLEPYAVEAKKRGRALWCGEFGVNYRQCCFGEDLLVRDMIAHFKKLDIHWTYWTWKAIKGPVFPDGVCSYYPNPAWVNRMGPVTGWDTWSRTWKAHKDGMIASWRTETFTINSGIVKALWKE